MRYAFFYVHAYTFLLTFTTFPFSLLGGLCIHRLKNIRFFTMETRSMRKTCSDIFYSRIVRLSAFSHVWVQGSLGCSFAELALGCFIGAT